MFKLRSLTSVLKIASRLKKQQKKIVFTNGCFDLIHWGHVSYLTQAKKQGDILIVGMNSDASVRKLKGPFRPLFPEKERAEILSGFTAVGYIVFFDEETPFEIINSIQPDVLVKGGDYTLDTIVGRDIVENSGGKVVTIPFVKGMSSTGMIERIIK